MPGNDHLSAILYGTSTGGAAGSAETTSTLGHNPLNVRVPPDLYTLDHLQFARLRELGVAISTDLKGGTRLLARFQSSSPFGAGELGFWFDSTSAPRFSSGTTAYQLLHQLWPVTSVTAATYTISATDHIIACNRAGTIGLTLPAAASGRNILVYDTSGAAASNNITITRAGSDTINGATSFVISTNYGGCWLSGKSGGWTAFIQAGSTTSGAGWVRTAVADTAPTIAPTAGAPALAAYTSISAARIVTGTTAGTSGAPVFIRIVDESGSASATNTITFSPSSGNIDGSATKVVVASARGWWMGYCNGTNWFTHAGTNSQSFPSATLAAPVLSGTVTGTFSIGGTPTLASVLTTNAFVGPSYGGTSTNVPSPTWTNFTLLNSWAADGGGGSAPRYMKDSLGRVRLQGWTESGSSGTVMAQLPGGFRPSHTLQFPVTTDSAKVGVVQIATTGDITIYDGSGYAGSATLLTTLDSINFFAAQ